MSTIRRFDHVAILVRDTDAAVAYFSGQLGLRVAHVDEPAGQAVRLTYLDCGNTFIQLVQPLDPTHELARRLEEQGEGLHHICFGVGDVSAAVSDLSDPGFPRMPLGSGRGRTSGFIANGSAHGVVIECTAFVFSEDVSETPGWLPPEP